MNTAGIRDAFGAVRACPAHATPTRPRTTATAVLSAASLRANRCAFEINESLDESYARVEEDTGREPRLGKRITYAFDREARSSQVRSDTRAGPDTSRARNLEERRIVCTLALANPTDIWKKVRIPYLIILVKFNSLRVIYPRLFISLS